MESGGSAAVSAVTSLTRQTPVSSIGRRASDAAAGVRRRASRMNVVSAGRQRPTHGRDRRRRRVERVDCTGPVSTFGKKKVLFCASTEPGFGDCAHLRDGRRFIRKRVWPSLPLSSPSAAAASCGYQRFVFAACASGVIPRTGSSIPTWRSATSVARSAGTVIQDSGAHASRAPSSAEQRGPTSPAQTTSEVRSAPASAGASDSPRRRAPWGSGVASKSAPAPVTARRSRSLKSVHVTVRREHDEVRVVAVARNTRKKSCSAVEGTVAAGASLEKRSAVS